MRQKDIKELRNRYIKRRIYEKYHVPYKKITEELIQLERKIITIGRIKRTLNKQEV